MYITAEVFQPDTYKEASEEQPSNMLYVVCNEDVSQLEVFNEESFEQPENM